MPVFLIPRFQRILARCLLAVMLLAALAPGISRSLGTTEGWLELCTGDGMQWVQVVEGEGGAQPDNGNPAMDFCGYCTLAAERFAPLIPAMPTVESRVGYWPPPAFAPHPWGARFTPSPTARGPPLLT